MTLLSALMLTVAVMYLNNISWFVCVLFEDQHGWCITVDIELFLQTGSL